MGQHPPAEPLVQRAAGALRAGLGPAQPIPVAGLQDHLQGLPQGPLQRLGLRDHQLALAQLTVAPGRHQLPVIQQPQPGAGRGAGPFPAGQLQAHAAQPWPFHLQQPLAQALAHHQGQGRLAQGQGHQQADPPAGIGARGQAHQGVVGAAEAAAHQAAEGEVVGPALHPLPLQQSLELLVGAGFQHRGIVGSCPHAQPQRR